MLNHIVLQGRFVRDPELRHTQSGTPVCPFSLAVERDTKQQDGTRKTDFVECVAWRGTAEFASKYFKKGSMCIVEGRLELRDWTDNDGNKRRNAEVRVSGMHFCESKKSESAQSSIPAGTANFAELPDIDDEDLPF